MELQNIPLSIFYILLPDYLLHLFRMFIGNMSSPLHDHFRFPPTPRRAPTASSAKESDKSRMLDNPAENGAACVILDTIQRLLNIQCTTSQKPTTAAMTGIQFDSSRAILSPCYFFIDMQTHYDFDPCHKSDYATEDEHPCTLETALLKPQLQRGLSECSDDSFICFEDDNNSVDSDAFGWTDFNAEDNAAGGNVDDDDSQEVTKKVRFNLKPKIHVMHTWDFAYRAARKGSWQEIARDRDRFQQRIKRVAPIINVVMSSDHREKVYNDRFLDVN